MSQEQTPDEILTEASEHNATAKHTEALGEIVESQDEQDEKIVGLEAQLADMQGRVAELEAQLTAQSVHRTEEERISSGDLLDATNSRIDSLTAERDTEKGWGDTTAIETELQGHQDMKDYLEGRSYRDKHGNIHDGETGRFESEEKANNKPEAIQKSYEEMTQDELFDIWASAEDNQDKTTAINVQDELFTRLERESNLTDDQKTRFIDRLHSQMESRRDTNVNHPDIAVSTEEESTRSLAASDSDNAGDESNTPEVTDSTDDVFKEIEPEEPDSTGKELELYKKGKELELYTRKIVEVPKINSGDYPEWYAKRKNLVGGDLEALKAEADRLAKEIATTVEARVNNYIVEHPSVTPEEIRQFSIQCYVEAQNKLQQDVIAAIDGKGYVDAEGNEKGKSRARRFGAWLDRHGKKLKIGMLAAGVVGVTGAFVLSGGIAGIAYAGIGSTVAGAIKGGTLGLALSRHGSKESASRQIDLTNEEYQQIFSEMDPSDTARYASISSYIMDHYNKSADSDHALNVKKSSRAAIIGAVLGGVAQSINLESSQTTTTMSDNSHVIEVSNSAPNIPHHTIQPGELTGQVIEKTLNQMGIDASRFVNPDHSTNMQAIWDVVPKHQWHSMAELANGTHSMAGADNLSNEGIRYIIQNIVNNHDWGTHQQFVDGVSFDSITQLAPNMPATIAAQISGLILAAAVAREAAESTQPSDSSLESVTSGDSRDVVIQNTGGSEGSPSGQQLPSPGAQPETNNVQSDVDRAINEITSNSNPRNLVLNVDGAKARVVVVNSIGGVQRLLLEYGDGTRNYMNVNDLRLALSQGRANINRRGNTTA